MTQIAQQVSLYERDFLLWTEETTRMLKVKDFENLDLANLIEEIESLGRLEKKELKSRLLVLLEHLLKRRYLDMPQEYNGWERTIREQRIQLELLLDDSPSLKTQWQEACDRAWALALKKVTGDYPQAQFPSTYPFPTDLQALLNQHLW
ncbi:MAG: DUF29 domain-containing protein [Leptolyngbyaceae bacterium]|nr:DUF29 domain-containing protein [Leptolyngbyaceae bacterium]